MIGGPIIYVRLGNLIASKRDNARSFRPTTHPADKDLLESIRDEGLFKNLMIGPDDEVIGGERRRLALRALAADSHSPITLDSQVPCIRKQTSLHEASFNENYTVLPMHEADEFIAFSRMIDEGASIGEVSKRYRKSEREIQRSMRLAGLAPAILKAFGEDKITIDVAHLYARTSDTARQMAVWKGLGVERRASRYHVGQALDDNTLCSTDGVVMFVGLDAYREAGGKDEVDLFTLDRKGEPVTRVLDRELVYRLADERLDAERAALAERWLWVIADHPRKVSVWGWETLPQNVRQVPEALAASMKAIETKLSDPDRSEASKQKLKATLKEHKASVRTEHMTYSARSFAHGGAIVTYDDFNGALIIKEGLLRKAEAKKLERERTAKKGDDGEMLDEAPQTSMSTSFSRDLDQCRAQARREAMVRSPALAMLLLHFEVVSAVLNQHGREYAGRSRASGVALEVEALHYGGAESQIRDMPATTTMGAAHDALDLSWIEAGDTDERFQGFAALDEDERARQVGWAVGERLRSDGLPAAVASALPVDMAGAWRPTMKNYVERVKADELRAVGVEFYGEQFAVEHAKTTRKVLRELIGRVFTEDEAVLTERERTIRVSRLPAAMR